MKVLRNLIEKQRKLYHEPGSKLHKLWPAFDALEDSQRNGLVRAGQLFNNPMSICAAEYNADGRLEWSGLKPGDPVKAGQLVVKLIDSQLQPIKCQMSGGRSLINRV